MAVLPTQFGRGSKCVILLGVRGGEGWGRGARVDVAREVVKSYL